MLLRWRNSRGRRWVVSAAALLLATLAHGVEPPRQAGDEYHFVVLGDSQFDAPATFNRMIDDLRHVQPAFVVQVGDMIEGYSSNLTQVRNEWRRFKDQIAPLDTISYLPVPGNHDLYNAEKKADQKLLDLYRATWGDPYYSFEYRNARFVVLNTDAPDEEDTIGRDQMNWLRDTLARSTAEHVFVFMHRPPLFLENAKALHALFKEHPVRYVFYGHHHHYHYQTKDDIHYVMTNAAADSAHAEERVGGFHHFLMVSVRDANVRYAVVKADAVLPPDYVRPEDNYDLFAIGRSLFPKSVVLEALGKNRYQLDIPMSNPTDRDLSVYVSCSSEDDRWRFDPVRVAPVRLTGKRSSRLSVVASHAANRVPESEPECRFRVPVQTHDGHWYDYEQSVVASKPSSR